MYFLMPNADAPTYASWKDEILKESRETIAHLLHSGSQTHQIRLNAGDGERIAWLHARGEVIDQHSDGDQLQLSVKLSPENWARFERL